MTDATPAMRRPPMPLVTVVIPVFNEETNVEQAHRAVTQVFDGLAGRYRLEILFADNHSTDRTFEILSGLAAADPRVKVLRYNRNYGFQRSLLTAYRHASGDAAVQLDCDLQDPPALIPQFLDLWQQGHDMVVGLRRRRSEGKAITAMRRFYYALLNRISDDRLIADAGDFRLVDRSLLDRLHRIDDQNPYVRGLLSSLARNDAAIAYDRDLRRRGRSNFPFRRLVGFALDGIFSHSMVPLRLMAYFGFLVSAAAFGVAAVYLLGALIFGRDWPSGFATTILLILLGIGVNGIFLGIIGEYIGRIYQQVRQRPLTVVERSLNMDEKEESP